MSDLPTDPVSDDELLARVVGGDASAFTALFRRRQGHVYRFALHLSGAPAVAEDVTQDVFMAVIRDASRYESGRSSVTAWLCGIARNFALRRLERDRGTVPLADRADDSEADAPAICPDPLGDLAQAERLEALRAAVSSLPIRYREIVVLCDLQEMSYADAAAAIGCAVGTVRSRLHRGRALLGAKMRASEDREPRTAGQSGKKSGTRCCA